MTDALRIEGLTRRFGGLIAVDGVDLALGSGRLHAIIGPNGAGKTTLFNLISGLLRADAGRVLFDGRDLVGLAPHAITRLGIGRTLQIKSVFPALTARENVWIAAQARAGVMHPFRRAAAMRETAEAVERILDEMQLGDLADRPAGTLSYGDVALLEIAIALATRPRLLLLDEPICGMSPSETARTAAKIKDLARSIDIVLIEHDMEVVFDIADEITVLALGRVLCRGTPREIAADERVREAYLGRLDDDELDDDAPDAGTAPHA